MGQDIENKKIKNKSLRHSEYYGMIDTADELYRRSLRGENFRNLMDLISSENNIMLAFRNIKANKGSRTPGTDGLTIEYYAAMPQGEFIQLVQNKLRNYHPKPVRRKDIPKSNGKTRPLGIPCMLDRLVQQCILQILEPVCEARFYEDSYGFRPLRSAENAIAAFESKMVRTRMYYVVDVDIKGFFDNVDHKRLLKQLWNMGIRDSRVLMVIKEILKAPVAMPDGSIIKPERGTPQGGILSPLLANIVLNELDWWIHSQWLGQYKRMKDPLKLITNKSGEPHYGHFYRRMRKTNLKEMYIVRYADDFKILCSSYTDAEKILIAVTEWLDKRLHLQAAPDKTKITNLRKQYTEFLGIKIKLKPAKNNSRNKWVICSHMTDKAQKNAKSKLHSALKRVQKSGSFQKMSKAVDGYNTTVLGLHYYYRMASCVNLDFSSISYSLRKSAYIRIRGLSPPKAADLALMPAWAREYAKSKQFKVWKGKPFLPAGFVQTKHPRFKDKSWCLYTSQGRKDIHETLQLDMNPIIWFRQKPDPLKSVQFNDNRISRFAGQYGKCAVTGQELTAGNIYTIYADTKCRNIDNYFNLRLVSPHGLLLLQELDSRIAKSLTSLLKLNPVQIKWVNQYRSLHGLAVIE